MTNLNLPSGAKPVENPNSFAHQSVGNNQPAPNAWAAMPSQVHGQTQGYNPSIPASGMGAPIPMAAAAPIAQPAAAPMAAPQMAPAGAQMQQQPAAYQQMAPVMNTMQPVANPAMNAVAPVAQNNEAAALQTFDPVEFEAADAEHQQAPAVDTAMLTFLKGIPTPSTYDGWWELATRMCTSVFCPEHARTPADAFFLIAKARSVGLPWTAAFTEFYVISAGNAGPRVGMSVKAKEHICRRHGQWTVSVDRSTGVATAMGYRYSDGAKDRVVYDGFDAALRGRLGRGPNGEIVGFKTWADKWPDMLQARAVGRLLDRLFADVVGGVATVEEIQDMIFEAELHKDAAALNKEESESKTITALKKVRNKKVKAIEAKPVEPAPAALESKQVEPVATQPAAPSQSAEAAASPYDAMKQGAPANTVTTLNDLISETETNLL